MSEREDRVRLQHMLDASRQAITFVQGRRRNDLDTGPAIAGTRDRLAHAYFDVDLDQLWQIVAADLPALVPVLERALATAT